MEDPLVTDDVFLASGQVLTLVRDLISRWCDWETQRQLYLQTVLPQLKAQTLRKSTLEEQNLMRRIKRIASQAEWQKLEWIAEHLEAQEKQWWAFSHKLESLLRSGAFDEAENYASRFGNPSLVEWCKAREQDTRKRITERIERLLEAGDLTAAEQTLEMYRSVCGDAQCAEWTRRIASQTKANHISRAREEIQEALEHFDFNGAEHVYAELRARYPEATIPEYDGLVSQARRRQVGANLSRVRAEIKEALGHFDFDGAEQLHAEFRELHPEVAIPEYDELVSQARRSQLDMNLRERLEEFKFKEARKLFENNRSLISSDEFAQLVEEYQCKRELSLLSGLLKDFRFADADNRYTECEHVSREEYEALKAEYIADYAKSHFLSTPNPEQALALASTSRNLLVQARAGSGKTRVAAQKTGLLLHDQIQDPDHILILAFNTKAAEEIGDRIKIRYGFDQYGNARTFHSFAWRLVLPKEALLFDDTRQGVAYKKQSLFIQKAVIEEIMNPAFCEKMYEFFRRELAEIERAGLLLSEEEYYTYRRNIQEYTLGGQLVKSRGEKWIADLLFEHGIWYEYERVYGRGGELYRPDFSVYHRQHDYIIEHWAVDEEGTGQLPKGWRKSRPEYLEEMRWKREHWKNKGVPLVETSVKDAREGRQHFEAILRRRLEDVGIDCHRIPQEELYDKVKDIHLSRFANLARQFIQKAKKTGLSPGDTQKRIDEYNLSDERTSVFLRLAARIYRDYEQQKRQQNMIDYDDLLLEATELVHSTESRCSFHVDHQRPVGVRDLKWIIVDEFQDFSPLFNGLIEAIRRYNPGLRLFCVGDDWQAINGFAGSDLCFFHEFEERYDQSRRTDLLTNHRSCARIVHESNALMRDLGPSARPRDDAKLGLIQIEPIDGVWVEGRSDQDHEEAYRSDRRFRFASKSGNIDMLASRYLKRCYELMTESENLGREVAILSRTNRIYSVPLPRFKRKLVACLSEEEKQQFDDPREAIRVSTVHRFKGLEERIVILVRVCEGSFPLLHPDNSLFTFFGRDEGDVLREERRLFYVAMTRAKERLYILTERDRESPFLKQLPAYDAYQREHT
jgi:DNA helicase-4